MVLAILLATVVLWVSQAVNNGIASVLMLGLLIGAGVKPSLALSGFGSEQDVKQAREAGFSEHLTKPINFERLEKTIQNLLS